MSFAKTPSSPTMSQGYTAFTLAEVLITLAIIGVVAAMTIPTLINNAQEQAYLTQFKKVYTNLSQSYLSAAQESGTADTWLTGEELYNNMKPYLKIIEDCPATDGCFPNVVYKTIKGGDAYPFYQASYGYKVRLADGSSVLFQTSWEIAGTIYVDINGDKAPNQFGYDMFVFRLINKSGSPAVVGYNTDWALNSASYCSKTIPSGGWIDGGSCSNWILKNSNMDYLHREFSDAEWSN